jgi:hypothetical protein
MLIVPFQAPLGYKWVIVSSYFDPTTNTLVRARDHHRDSLCLLVSAGSVIVQSAIKDAVKFL